MMAYSDLKNQLDLKFNKTWSSNMQKTLLYMSFIKNLLHGKFFDEEKNMMKIGIDIIVVKRRFYEKLQPLNLCIS